MYLFSYYIGSSSVKVCLVSTSTEQICASALYPKQEMSIKEIHSGWAEQEPADWWTNLKTATAEVISESGVLKNNICAIGISYQMYGLVCVDKNMQVLSLSIIWCDSRTMPYGEKALQTIGEQECLTHLLNSPSNFTAAKLAWVKENEPNIFAQIYIIMFLGDCIPARLTGNNCTTASGLSEDIFWDFAVGRVTDKVIDYFGFAKNIIPDIVSRFSWQSTVTEAPSNEFGLTTGIQVCYRAGDQTNNSLSLKVLRPGEIAATADTSGVLYVVKEQIKYESVSRVYAFVHVNYTTEVPRTGVLLCINGMGILTSWAKTHIVHEGINYAKMNDLAVEAPIDADGLSVLFGNCTERMLSNKEVECTFDELNFNIQNERNLLRVVQEKVTYAFQYGIKIMQNISVNPKTIRAGNAIIFLSPLYRETLATVIGTAIELFDTGGTTSMVKGACVGVGIYKTPEETLSSLKRIATINLNSSLIDEYEIANQRWEGV